LFWRFFFCDCWEFKERFFMNHFRVGAINLHGEWNVKWNSNRFDCTEEWRIRLDVIGGMKVGNLFCYRDLRKGKKLHWCKLQNDLSLTHEWFIAETLRSFTGKILARIIQKRFWITTKLFLFIQKHFKGKAINSWPNGDFKWKTKIMTKRENRPVNLFLRRKTKMKNCFSQFYGSIFS
jgi:hypothetical protein